MGNNDWEENIKKENINFEKTNDVNKTNDDHGFHSFGSFPKFTSKDENKHIFSSGPWPTIVQEEDKRIISRDSHSRISGEGSVNEDVDDIVDTHSSYGDSEYDSVDGSSPAVIAQVSELLNYVYGNTSVTGQIERVSTIMQSYEGRESVLLELLETKALMKADIENE